MIKLSAKEEEVMEFIWQLGECTPRDVFMLYEEPRPLINGIQNAFQSLERKGYLAHRQQGRGYVYWPIVEKRAYGRTKLGSFIDRYFDGSCLSVVSEFVHEERLTEAELMQFLADLMKNEK